MLLGKGAKTCSMLRRGNLAMLFLCSVNSAISTGNLDFSMQQQKLLDDQSCP